MKNNTNRRAVQVPLVIAHDDKKIFATEAPYRLKQETQDLLNELTDSGYSFILDETGTFPAKVFLKFRKDYVVIEAEWHDGLVETFSTQGFFQFFIGR